MDAQGERTTDSKGREWHVLVRADDSVCLYYTVPDQPGHYIVYDSLGRLSGEGARLARTAIHAATDLYRNSGTTSPETLAGRMYDVLHAVEGADA